MRLWHFAVAVASSAVVFALARTTWGIIVLLGTLLFVELSCLERILAGLRRLFPRHQSIAILAFLLGSYVSIMMLSALLMWTFSQL